jgi:outer membrane biogenesis lipoprotein LolB
MATTRVIHSILLAAGVLLMTACASQPEGALLEKKFQQAAQHYQKFQHEGRTVYCKKEKVLTSAVPVTQCLSEAELRLRVENSERHRNAVGRPLVAGAGQGGIG